MPINLNMMPVMGVDPSAAGGGQIFAPQGQAQANNYGATQPNVTPASTGSTAGASAGFDWNTLLGAGAAAAGAYGQYASGQNQNQGIGGLYSHAGTTPTTYNAAAGNASAGPGTLNSGLNQQLQNAFGGSTNLTNQALGNAFTSNQGLPQNIQNAAGGLNNAVNQGNANYSNLYGGVNQQLGNTGKLYNAGMGMLNNGVSQSADQSALSNIQQGGQNFNNVYQGSLQNIMGALQPQQQQQLAQSQDQQFARGQMGTSGGALQSKALYQGFGQADLAAQQQAYNQALQQQQQNVNNATAYSGIANNNMAMGGSLLNSAFSQFGNLTGLGSQLTGNQFNMNNQNIGAQQQLSMTPGMLAQQQAQLAGTAQGIGAGINTMGNQNASLAQQAGYQNAGLAQNAYAAGGKLSQTQTANGGSTLSGLLNGLASGGQSSLANQIMQMFGGNTGGGGSGTDPGAYYAQGYMGDNTAMPGLGGGAFDPNAGGSSGFDPNSLTNAFGFPSTTDPNTYTTPDDVSQAINADIPDNSSGGFQ